MTLQIKSHEEYKAVYKKSVEQPEAFWAEQAETFQWQKKWDKVLEWDFKTPDVKWFAGAKLNITENCLDRHLKDRANQTAILWEPNNPDEAAVHYTYQELYTEVCKFGNALRASGIKKGDRVCFYMPMVAELAIGVLACARIGAVHSVVFAGFSAKALADRINDCEAKIVLTNDGAFRGNKEIPLKDICDEALENCPSIKNVLNVKRTFREVQMKEGRDIWWHEVIANYSDSHTAEIMDAEDPLFILYTSGSTGKPKGLVHTTAGYMVYAQYSFENVFQVKDDDIYWCSADIGWITGHSYIVYGPLLSGATTMMFEGVPTYPDAGRFWQIIDKYKVTHFYTAPTAIRALQACDHDLVKKQNLSSLKVLGTVGEPINQEAWDWYKLNVGKEKCPIVDTWWQTETGGIMISTLAGITDEKPCYATLPLPGISPCLVDSDGNEVEGNDVQGYLCIKSPWPSIARTIWGDHKRYEQTYFSTYENKYFTGDGARRDTNGLYRITGRVDDVINVSGHRIGTAEVEDAINLHPNIIESAVVGFPHDIKGQGIYAYLISDGQKIDFQKELSQLITKEIGPIAKPDQIQIVEGLPKTRSGKIMRRILRKIAADEFDNFGDISTLLDPGVVEKIKLGKTKS